MADMITLELITPGRVVAEVKVTEVIAPGIDGEFGVLPGHTFFISQLRPGEVRFNNGQESHRFVVGRGFAEVGPEHISILTDAALEPTSLDAQELRTSLERDEARLKAVSSSDPEAAVLMDRIERNQAFLAAVSSRH